MPLTSLSSLVDLLRETGLLTPGQLTALADLEAAGVDARAAASNLQSRQWLTAYQVEQLFGDQPKANLVVGPYILMERLGEGGMGQVFKARHQMLQRVVALKLILAERLTTEPDAVQRFEREARAAALLSHPHIVLIYDAGSVGAAYFIAMEYIDGTDLGRLVREGGPLPYAQACDFIRQAALGLQHAHENGMVHRDIKPSNLLLARTTGQVKVLDMGLARIAQADDENTSITREGVIIGTPDYIAPEQARNARKVDIRSDLYSLGAAFYYLLTGQPPFREGTAIEKLLMHQLDEPEPVSKWRPGLPGPVAAVVHRLLAKPPEERFQTPAELATALAQLLARLTQADQVDLAAAAVPPPPAAAPASATDDEDTAKPVPAGPSSRHGYGASSSSETAEVGFQAKHLARISGHIGAVISLAFNWAQDTLATGGMDGSVRLWDFARGVHERAVIRKHVGAVSALAFAHDDSILAAASGSADGMIWLGSTSGAVPKDLTTLQGHAGAVFGLAFSPNCQLLASGGQDLTVRLWDLSSRGRCRAILEGHQAPIRGIALAPSGRFIASASPDGSVRLWEIAGRRPREYAVLPHPRGAYAVSFSADGELLAAAGNDGIVRLWDLSQEGHIQLDAELAGHEGPIRLVIISENCDRLVAVGEGCRLTVWFQESERVQNWLLPRMTHPFFAITPDGRYLGHGNVDGITNVYRVSDKRTYHGEEARRDS